MKLQTLNTWHKVMGMLSTVFIVILSISGFMLLHTEDLRLQDRLVTSGALLGWYGIAPVQAPIAYPVGGKWVTRIDRHVYLERLELGSREETLSGALEVDGMYILAYENSMDLYTSEGELIERLTAINGLPQGILEIGLGADETVYVRTSGGEFSADESLSSWQPVQREGIRWSKPARPPAALIDGLLEDYRGSGLPLERVVLDLHSGRILGDIGVWLVDIAVLMFLVLSMTGWWCWFRRRSLQKQIDEEY